MLSMHTTRRRSECKWGKYTDTNGGRARPEWSGGLVSTEEGRVFPSGAMNCVSQAVWWRSVHDRAGRGWEVMGKTL